MEGRDLMSKLTMDLSCLRHRQSISGVPKHSISVRRQSVSFFLTVFKQSGNLGRNRYRVVMWKGDAHFPVCSKHLLYLSKTGIMLSELCFTQKMIMDEGRFLILKQPCMQNCAAC